jgi:hypothetical protein
MSPLVVKVIRTDKVEGEDRRGEWSTTTVEDPRKLYPPRMTGKSNSPVETQIEPWSATPSPPNAFQFLKTTRRSDESVGCSNPSRTRNRLDGGRAGCRGKSLCPVGQSVEEYLS